MGGELRNAKQVILRALMDNSTVAGLVEGRVFPEHQRDPDTVENAYPFVVVSVVGGTPVVTYDFQDLSFEIWAYSRLSLDAAEGLYDACKAALHAQRTVVTGITMAVVTWETARPRSGWNEALSAWYVVGRYNASTVA